LSENALRGSKFEDAVEERLKRLFPNVKRNVTIKGYSGTNWHVDFLVNDTLLAECSLQKRMSTKIAETFMKFKDIQQSNPVCKGCLVVSDFHTYTSGRNKKRRFASTGILVMTKHNYPILVADDIGKLFEFLKGNLTAAKMIHPPYRIRRLAREKLINEKTDQLIQLLKNEPLSLSAMSNLLNIPRDTLDSIIIHPLLSEGKIVRLGYTYGIDMNSLVIARIKHGQNGDVVQNALNKWMENKILEYLADHYSFRTVSFAKHLGISFNVLCHVIHKLEAQGMIRRLNKDGGVWSLAQRDNLQSTLDVSKIKSLS